MSARPVPTAHRAPAKAGAQIGRRNWVPAFAGTRGAAAIGFGLVAMAALAALWHQDQPQPAIQAKIVESAPAIPRQYLALVQMTEQAAPAAEGGALEGRSEEHTSELQSLMRISYAVFCLKKKNMKKE